MPPKSTLDATSETVVWGYITADVPPVLTIKSGQTVRTDTVSHQNLMSNEDPANFFADAGIPREEALQDASASRGVTTSIR